MTITTNTTSSIQDVACWFISQQPMTHKKLQYLCYYAEAWSEALLDSPICTDNNFEAWVNGPVNRTLYNDLKQFGWNSINRITIDQIHLNIYKEDIDNKFTKDQLEILQSVWNSYGKYSFDQLEMLIHTEEPWIEQRKGIEMFEECKKENFNEKHEKLL